MRAAPRLPTFRLLSHQKFPSPRGDAAFLRSSATIGAGRRTLLIEESPPPCHGLMEQRQDRLRRLIGDGQSLDAELLLDLQRLQRGTFLSHKMLPHFHGATKIENGNRQLASTD